MGALEGLGIDVIGAVSIGQKDWYQTALAMIKARRQQVTTSQGRAITEIQQVAVISELKRMSDLEFYVRSCQEGAIPGAREGTNELMEAVLAGATWDDLQMTAKRCFSESREVESEIVVGED